MKITATHLRENVYNILDSVLKGEVIEVERSGKIVKLVAKEPKNKLKNLRGIPNLIKGNPATIDKIDWSKEWKP